MKIGASDWTHVAYIADGWELKVVEPIVDRRKTQPEAVAVTKQHQRNTQTWWQNHSELVTAAKQNQGMREHTITCVHKRTLCGHVDINSIHSCIESGSKEWKKKSTFVFRRLSTLRSAHTMEAWYANSSSTFSGYLKVITTAIREYFISWSIETYLVSAICLVSAVWVELDVGWGYDGRVILRNVGHLHKLLSF